MENLERSEERLENIQTVEPIIAALRTISLGGWRASRKRRRHVQQILTDLTRMASALSLSVHFPEIPAQPPGAEPAQSVVLVVGSERGLCGRFNVTIVNRCEEYLKGQEQPRSLVELVAVGSRISHMLRRRGLEITATLSLSGAAVPTFDLSSDVCHQWLKRYETGSLQRVVVIHNQGRGGTEYEPAVTQIIPPLWSAANRSQANEAWPAPIIETDPLRLLSRIVEQSIALHLYQALLESREVEHLARYQLTEAATQNIERLIDELRTANQIAARQRITREMQELAVASGLLGSSSKRNPGAS